MKHGLLFLAFIAFAATPVLTGCGEVSDTSQLSTESVTLTWDAPTKNADGTTLTDLAGYRVYYGKTSGLMTNTTPFGTSTSVGITDLEFDTTYYLAVAATDYYGNESNLSDEVSFLLPGTD